MDFHKMKRKELQALCKKHNIPANLSNSQMALNLSSLLQEKEKPTKRGRASSKASIETVEEKGSSITIRQSKKVRFSPTNETFEYVELRSGRKEKTKGTQTKSSMKPAARGKGNSVEKIDIKSNKEVTGKTVRSLRSRVQETVEGDVIPVIDPPVGIKRGRRAGKDVDSAESAEEIVIKPVRVTRSRGQTASEGNSVPVPEQRVGKKRCRGKAVENVDGVKPVADIVSIPVRTTRSRAQISQEGGKLAASKPKVEKEISARGKPMSIEPSKGIVDPPVRTTRSRVQTSKEGGVSAMPNSPIEQKRASKRSKVGDATIKSTVEVLDTSDNVVSQKAASVQDEDVHSRRSLRNRELGGTIVVQRTVEVAPQAKGRNANRRKSIMPQKTGKAEKVDTLKENENVVPHAGPLRRSHRHTSLLEPTTSSNEDLKSPVVDGRNRYGKQSHVVSSGTGKNTGKKQRDNLNIVKEVIDVQDTHSVEESFRRFTRSATKSFKDNSSNKRSVGRSTRSSKQEGSKEIFAQPSILEQAKHQTPVSKSKKFQMDGGEKEEISTRKRRGDHLLKEDSLEKSPKRVTRTATKHEFVKDSTSPRSTKFNRSARSSKQGEVKGQLSSSISRKSQTDDRQLHKGISGRKERGALTIEGGDVGMRFTSPNQESSRRLTRRAIKSNSNAASNLTEKSVGKSNLKNRAKTPSQEVKTTPSVGRSSAMYGVENVNDAQFSLPEAVKSASGPAMEVIYGTSTKTVKESTSSCALKGDGTEEVCAQISSINKGKNRASGLEEELASESERLQVDNIEAENVVTVNETTMITETVIGSGNGRTDATNEIATSTDFYNSGLPNLEKVIPLEGTSANSIEIMPEVLASEIERSIDIHTSGQELGTQFTGTTGVSESEFIDIEIEVPLEEGTSALEGALDIAPGSSELVDQEMVETLTVLADDGFDGTTSTAIGCLPVDQSHSLSEAHGMREQSMDAQPSRATSDVIVRDDGVNSEDYRRLSTETVGDTFVEDDLHAFDQSGGSRENDQHIFQDAGRVNENGTDLIKDRNLDVEGTENNMEFTKPHEFSTSPRQTKEVEILFATSSIAGGELPSQFADVIRSDNTTSRRSEEPLETFDGTVGASATTSFSEKQKTSVKVCTGPPSNENIDLVGMNLEKAQDLNLEKLQSEHKTVELDMALEENSVDHKHNSDNAEIVKSPTSGVFIPDIIGSDDFGFENKLESTIAKDGFTSCQVEQIVVESSELHHDAHSLKSVREISGSHSFVEKSSGEMIDMNGYDGKASDTGDHTDDAVTCSVYIGTTSKKVVGHSFDVQEFDDTVSAEESQHNECSSKENEPQVACETTADGIHSESEQDFDLQKIFETPVLKDVQECNNTVPLEESQHEDLHCKDNQLQSDEDYQLQKFFEFPVSKDTLETEDRVPQEEGQPEDDPSTEDQMLNKLGDGNARLISCEDINYGELWNEDTLQTLFATPATSSVSSKNARSYFHEKMKGEEQDIEIAEGSHSVDAGRNDQKNAILTEKENTSKDISDGPLYSNKSMFEEDHCDSSIGCQTSHGHLYATEEITDQPAENKGSPCNLMDANHTGEQPGEPEDSMKQIWFGASDISITNEDDEPLEGFDVDGDTEQYFHSEHPVNTNFENFGGDTQENLTEVAQMSGHDYTALDEPEADKKEAGNSVVVQDDKPMVGGNGKEKEKELLDKAHSISDKNIRAEASSDMGSRTDPSSDSDGFATDEGI